MNLMVFVLYFNKNCLKTKQKRCDYNWCEPTKSNLYTIHSPVWQNCLIQERACSTCLTKC